MQPNPRPNKYRVCIHEAGHLILQHEYSQKLQEAIVYEVNGDWRGQAPPVGGARPTSGKEWIDAVAILFGGQIAVAHAIDLGILPRLSRYAEFVSGWLGFGGDDESCDEQQARYFSLEANQNSPEDVYDAPYTSAVDAVKRRWPHVLAVADLLFNYDMVTEADLQKILY